MTRAGAGSVPDARTVTRQQHGRRDAARRRAAAQAPARPRHWSAAAERAGATPTPTHRGGRPARSLDGAGLVARPDTAGGPAVHGATALERAFPVRTPAERRTATRARLRVVDETGRRRRRRLKVAAWFVGVVGVALMFGAAAFHVLIVQSQFRLDDLGRQVTAEQQRYELLRLQVANLSSPDTIVQTAKGQLGMVEPDQTTYLVAEGSGTGAGASATTTPGDPADPISPAAWDEIKERLAQRP